MTSQRFLQVKRARVGQRGRPVTNTAASREIRQSPCSYHQIPVTTANLTANIWADSRSTNSGYTPGCDRYNCRTPRDGKIDYMPADTPGASYRTVDRLNT